MSWHWTPFAILLILFSISSTGTAAYVFWRRYGTLSITAALILLTSAVWMWGYALELASPGLGAKVLWEKVQFVSMCIIPTAWLVYSMQFVGRHDWLTRRTLTLLSILPLIIILLTFTNEAHGLIRSSYVLDPTRQSLLGRKTYGPASWVHFSYGYLVTVVGILFLIDNLVHAGRLRTWRSGVLLFVVSATLLINMASVLFDWNPIPNLDLTPFALGLALPPLAWITSRLRHMDIMPVASEMVLEGMRDGVIVLDAQHRVVHMNAAAQRLTGHSLAEAMGFPIRGLWPAWPDGMEFNGDGGKMSHELVTGEGDGQRVFDMRISPVTDWRGHLMSQVVVLYDVTELKLRTEELSTVLKAAQAVSSTLDLGQVLLRLADQLLDVSGFQICTISSWDRKSEQVRILAECTRASWPDAGGESYSLGDYPATERVLTTGEPEVIQLGMDDPESDWMREVGLGAVLMLPLRAGEQIIGLAEVGRPEAEFTHGQEALSRCQQVLKEAAGWLLAPLSANSSDVLLELAGQLAAAGSGSWCSFSAWHRSDGEVRSQAEYGKLIWALGEGPSYAVEEWPSVVRALEEGKSTIARLSDLSSEESDKGELSKWGARTSLTQPLSFKGRPIGLVELFDVAEEREISNAELRLWKALADQAAVAIENARLYAETERRLLEQIALREASTIISSSLDLPDVLTRIAEQMGQAVDATSSYICSLDPEAGTSLVLAEYIGPHACLEEYISDLGVSYEEADDRFLTAMVSGQHWIDQVDAPNLPEKDRDHMRRHRVESILYVPLYVRGQAIGYAELWETRRRREFSMREIALCQAIARSAAVGLENARLYEQAQRELARREQAEEQIKASLQEKEILLKEIHHRVKNNLQVISSILSLQTHTTTDEGTLAILEDSQNRVRSMALIHEKLYQSNNLAAIDLAEYTQDLVSVLYSAYHDSAEKVSLKVQGQAVLLGVDEAVQCGLILSELISNALKHAFPSSESTLAGTGRPVDEKPEIRVELREAKDRQVTLIVADNGIGLPSDLDFFATDSLGLHLVTILVEQLDGRMDVYNNGGAQFKITFTAP